MAPGKTRHGEALAVVFVDGQQTSSCIQPDQCDVEEHLWIERRKRGSQIDGQGSLNHEGTLGYELNFEATALLQSSSEFPSISAR